VFDYTIASHHSKRPIEDNSSPAHSNAEQNKDYERKTSLTQSTQSYQLKSETEDQRNTVKPHTQDPQEKFQEAATQTSQILTMDVSTQTAESPIQKRSIAIQTDFPNIPERFLEIREDEQNPLPLNPSNHLQLPFPTCQQLEAILTGCYTQAPFLPSPAVLWQSVVTKIIATTLPSSISHAPSLPPSEEPPSNSENETDTGNAF
jgi:hypothetical protein